MPLYQPTSGLDTLGALLVMKALRVIASSGRAVICTIHQPSAELFYMFDQMLLLQVRFFYAGFPAYQYYSSFGFGSNLFSWKLFVSVAGKPFILAQWVTEQAFC